MTARVVYLMNTSLDGFINDANGSLDWTTVDDELHTWFNERERMTTAEIYGRRLYETMAAYWPTAEANPDLSAVEADYARAWNATPRFVFSRTLESANAATRLFRTNVVDEIESLKSEFDGEIAVGGATIAAALVERDLIDAYRLVVHPVILGGGTPFLAAGVRLDLQLTETRSFQKGAIFLAYDRRR